MKIAVDIDGVLFDLIGVFLEIFNQRYHTDYKKSDIIQYEFYNNWHVPKKEIYEIFYEIYESKCSAPLIDKDTPRILLKLNKKHHVYILSARNSKFQDILIKKLQDNSIIQGLSYRNLILVDERPYDSKLEYKYDIYIDDNPGLVQPIKKMNNTSLLLFNQPWNTQCVCTHNIFRVYDWKEIDKIIKKILQ
ncbi:MAG: hypothetical protein ACFE96_01655 [Candidatus Hermodarchaeota archaeon]